MTDATMRNLPRCNRCDGLLFGGKCPAPVCQREFDGDVHIAYETGVEDGREEGYEHGYEDAECEMHWREQSSYEDGWEAGYMEAKDEEFDND